MSTTKWSLDPAHSEVQFKVKHLAITTVTGSLGTFEGTVETTGDDFSTAVISFSGDAASISTGSEQRDGHLKSPDFFDVEKSPKITFTSSKFEKVDGSNFKLLGNLTIKGVSKPISLDVEFGGTQKDPWGNTKAGFTLSGKINRKDFGLAWNAPLEGGGFLVSEEVRILAEIQLAKQA
jgi:polyisoprenoid-binding protein YceI